MSISLPLLLGYVQVIQAIVMLVIAVALSAAAYYLMQPKGGSRGNGAAQDYALTNLATQGSFVPLLIGRRRVGALLAWVGDRQNYTEVIKTDGGKGGSSKKTNGATTWFEAGWHILCVGPATNLYQIWQNGDPQLNGSLDSINNPSGSAFQTVQGDTGYIYWGEVDQPIDADLTDAARVGVASRWPHVCYVYWPKKTLGPTPSWPQLEYDVETEPQVEGIGLDDALAEYPKVLEMGDYRGPLGPWAMYQILFNSYPHGLGLPLDEFAYGAAQSISFQIYDVYARCNYTNAEGDQQEIKVGDDDFGKVFYFSEGLNKLLDAKLTGGRQLTWACGPLTDYNAFSGSDTFKSQGGWRRRGEADYSVEIEDNNQLFSYPVRPTTIPVGAGVNGVRATWDADEKSYYFLNLEQDETNHQVYAHNTEYIGTVMPEGLWWALVDETNAPTITEDDVFLVAACAFKAPFAGGPSPSGGANVVVSYKMKITIGGVG